MNDLIVAPATPMVKATRGMIRLSGHGSHELAAKLFDAPLLTTLPCVQRATFRSRLGALSLELWLFAEGASFTGEESLEIHLPSSPLLFELVLEACREAGARDADAGEFTRRALLSGNLDLVQAEAVMALVSALDAKGAAEARRLLEGSFSKRISGFVHELEMLCARFEVAFDFDEEAAEQVDEDRFGRELREVAEALSTIRKRGFPNQGESARVVLIGEANAGKSTLFNALLGRERAAVANERGTTRDHVIEALEIQGLPLSLIDCAGFMELDEAGAIDAKAMASAREMALAADLLILVVPPSSNGEEMVELAGEAVANGATLLVLRSQVDLGTPCALATGLSAFPQTLVSAQQGEGIKELRLLIANMIRQRWSPEALPVSARAAAKIHHADDALAQALEALESGMPLEVASDMTRSALSELRAFLGDESGGNVLDVVFSSFCIGK